MASSLENDETLSSNFDEQLKNCLEIENTDMVTSSCEMQKKISSTIKHLEELTIRISYLGVFSTNETLKEMSTDSIKFLMLPVLLGSLSQKLVKPNREEVLRMASVYLKDFLKRCSDYELTLNTGYDEADIEKAPEFDDRRVSNPAKPTVEDLTRIGKQREAKIARYKEKKALSNKLEQLKKAIENPSHDEEVLRDYYLTMIKNFIYISLEELASISLERSMLSQMNMMKDDDKLQKKQEPPKPLRSFLITKDSIQKEVFGAGYPSLPMMSVDEFYQQRVKDGWFPPGRIPCGGTSQQQPQNTREETTKDDDDDNNIESLRQRDEWRDTHRTGWGNTYNRS